MSCRIGILKGGKVKTVFVAYPQSAIVVIEILNKFYTKESDVLELMRLGDIYDLSDSIENTKFFCRDKEEPLEVCMCVEEEAETLKDIKTDISPVDFYAVFNKKWNICKSYTDNWRKTKKLKNDKSLF